MSELATIDGTTTQLDVSYWGGVLIFAAQVADAVADTEFVPGALRGRREAVAATVLYGAEVGLTPMQSLAGIHIVDGRPAPSAELCRAMILRAGHTFHVSEMTGTRARVWGQRRGRPDSERVVVEWSQDMARAAGLLGRGAWQRYPRAMLVARATGDLARLLFPDVIKGLGYVAEDDVEALEAWAPEAADGTPGTPARKPLQRRKRTPRNTPVVEVEAPALEPVDTPDAPVEPDDYAAQVAAQARAAFLEGAADEPPPSSPRRVADEDEPLPLEDDLTPVGAGDPDSPTTPAPTLPDPAPEAPDDEGNAGPVLVGARPLKAIQSGLTRELGTAATREERHALIEAIVGHPITTSKELARADGYRVLDYLDRFAEGSAIWEYVDPTDIGAGMRVLDTRPPPDDA
jgi:hypothetical protein